MVRWARCRGWWPGLMIGLGLLGPAPVVGADPASAEAETSEAEARREAAEEMRWPEALEEELEACAQAPGCGEGDLVDADLADLAPLALEDWAADEAREAAEVLVRRERLLVGRARQRLGRASAWAALVPRLALAVQVGWREPGSESRGASVAVSAAGVARGPDGDDAARGLRARWSISLRLIWNLPRTTGGG